MKKYFLLVLALCFFGISFPQDTFFVMDGNGYPFPNASVFHKKKLVGKTDGRGLIDVSEIPVGETVVIKYEKLSTTQVIQKNERDRNLVISVYLVPAEVEGIPIQTWVTDDGSDDDDVSLPAPKLHDENEIYFVTDESAQFPGGREALNQWLQNNLVDPEVAKGTHIEGKCYLKFVVEKEGSITDVKILKSVADCPQCDAEAIRLVKAMPKWIPGKINGSVVRSYSNLPIKFKLDNN